MQVLPFEPHSSSEPKRPVSVDCSRSRDVSEQHRACARVPLTLSSKHPRTCKRQVYFDRSLTGAIRATIPSQGPSSNCSGPRATGLSASILYSTGTTYI